MTKEQQKRKAQMDFLVVSKLPDFIKAVRTAFYDQEEAILVLHQDAFAADYQEEELLLLGSAIKYAGERGVEVRIIGKNRETLPNEGV